ncbi:AFG2-interacting ribosome maturation factor-like [Antedon mediterranea]|uniref:AFG2-interacting ribosome maturation factor-like n=1 Tax=Antedon mediterranea TaxID=105859 RepID=UPI003AF607D8
MNKVSGQQMANEAEEVMLKQLKKSFKTVNVQETQWKEINIKSLVLVESLLNLAEQRNCCLRAVEAANNPVVAQFPDLADRLNASLLYSMEVVMKKLRENMHSLQEIQKKVSRINNNSMEVYNKHHKVLGLDRAIKRSATCPSISDMLEWLADLARIFSQEITMRNVLLDKIRYEDENSMKKLRIEFKEDNITNHAQDNVLKLVLFLEGD